MEDPIQLLKEAKEALSGEIYHLNPNGADWIECRACRDAARQISGVYHPIKHSPDCVLIRITNFLNSLE